MPESADYIKPATFTFDHTVFVKSKYNISDFFNVKSGLNTQLIDADSLFMLTDDLVNFLGGSHGTTSTPQLVFGLLFPGWASSSPGYA